MENQIKKTNNFNEIYLQHTNHRHIFVCEPITKELASTLTALLFYYDSVGDDQITIFINSVGGDVAALYNIYDVMQMIKSPISTICIGKAYSAAAVILAAGTPGLRLAFKNSNIMIHGVQCVFPTMNETDIKSSQNYFEFLTKTNDSVLKMLSSHTGQKIDKVKIDSKRDLFMDSKEALSYGMIDKII